MKKREQLHCSPSNTSSQSLSDTHLLSCSLRHPTLLHPEPIRRPLLTNHAKRGYLHNLMIARPSMKWIKMYYWEISLLCPHFVASVICLDVAVGVLEDLSIKTYWSPANVFFDPCILLFLADKSPHFPETSCLQWWLEISSYPSLHSCTSPEFSTFVKQDNNHRSIPGIHLLSQLELPVRETTQCVTHGRATAMSIRSCFTPATAMVHLYSTCRISLELELCRFWLFRMSAFAGMGKDFG